MMALATKVLVRFLMRDEEEQAQAVNACFRQAEAAGERLLDKKAAKSPMFVLLS